MSAADKSKLDNMAASSALTVIASGRVSTNGDVYLYKGYAAKKDHPTLGDYFISITPQPDTDYVVLLTPGDYERHIMLAAKYNDYIKVRTISTRDSSYAESGFNFVILRF